MMRVRTSRINKIFFVAFILLLGLPRPAAAALGSDVKTVRVGVAVTRSFQQDAAWKHTFLKRLDYTSKIFEREFKIRFEAVQFWNWTVPHNKQDSDYLMEDLFDRFPLQSHKEVDIIIGLTRLNDLSELENRRDVDTLGMARPFSGYLLLRYPVTPLYRVQQETVMTHEMGHLFGAIHTDKPDTIMAPVVKYQIPTDFDPENREIISMTRNIDFKKGLESLPARHVQKLLKSYLRLIAFDQREDFFYSLGIFYLRLGQTNDTTKAWEKALQLNPENSRLLYDLGILYSKTGDQAKAVQHLSGAARRLSHPAQAPMKVQALNFLGGAYFQQGNLDAAYHAWSGAAVLESNNQSIRGNLALIQLRRGKVDDAIRAFNALLTNDPHNAQILSNLGLAHLERRSYQQAIDYFTQALKNVSKKTSANAPSLLDMADPSEIHKNLGYAYWKMNNKKKAIGHFEISCKANPSAACIKRLGLIHFDLNEWDYAIQHLAHALKLDKTDPQIYGSLGVAFAKKSDDQKAIAVFQEGLNYIRDKKDTALLHKNIGNIYAQHQQWDLAVREFQLSLVNDWNNIDSHLGLALVYLAQNRLMEGRQSLVNLLQIDRNHQKAKEMLANIDRSIAAEAAMKQS